MIIMKKAFLLVFAVVSVSVFAFEPFRTDFTPDDLIELDYVGSAKNGGFSVWYDPDTFQPFVAWYVLTKENVLSDPGNDRPSYFSRDQRLVTALGRNAVPVHDDYTNSGYDRGHMVPADDFDDDSQKLAATFVTSNVCPQDPDLNRHGAWAELEKYARKVAVEELEVTVFSGPLYLDGEAFVGNTRKLPVPTHFFKLIVTAPDDRTFVEAYVVPNAGGTDKDISKYRVEYESVVQFLRFEVARSRN
jgi:endonuclease G